MQALAKTRRGEREGAGFRLQQHRFASAGMAAGWRP
jgi:hypothetical protein